MTAPRRTLVAGNWKMFLRRQSAADYCRRLVEAGLGEGPEVLLFPPSPLIPLVSEALEGTVVGWGGQDLHPESEGAHTGDVSAPHLLDWGCSWVLCGHSERRQDHGESDEIVAAKVTAAQSSGLAPILCVGESQAQRDRGETESVLRRQLTAAIPQGSPWALAYEPIWAIGTGQTATPESAEEAHRFLRRTAADVVGSQGADELRILYGGSVNPENCEALIVEPDIDGFLIGGASLDPASFLDIIRRCGTPE